jgi:hypothetical protein
MVSSRLWNAVTCMPWVLLTPLGSTWGRLLLSHTRPMLYRVGFPSLVSTKTDAGVSQPVRRSAGCLEITRSAGGHKRIPGKISTPYAEYSDFMDMKYSTLMILKLRNIIMRTPENAIYF